MKHPQSRHLGQAPKEVGGLQVSVIIPVYNAAAYVREAVESALAQPETAEVILVEDGSPDDSLVVCEALAAEHDKTRLLRHPNGENRGAGASRNLAIERSQSPFVAFLDADDYYLPGRFTVARRIFEQQPDIDGVYEAISAHFQSEIAERRWREAGMPVLTTLTQPVTPEDLFAALVSGRFGHFSTIGFVARRSMFERSGLFDAHLDLHQDTALWLKMAATGRLAPGRLEEPVAIRRVHEANRSSATRDTSEAHRHRLIMWETVWGWGLRHMTAAQQELTLRGLLSDAMRPYGDDPPLRRRARSLLRLMALAIRHPGLAARATFWRVAVQQVRAPRAWWERAHKVFR